MRSQQQRQAEQILFVTEYAMELFLLPEQEEHPDTLFPGAVVWEQAPQNREYAQEPIRLLLLMPMAARELRVSL